MDAATLTFPISALMNDSGFFQCEINVKILKVPWTPRHNKERKPFARVTCFLFAHLVYSLPPHLPGWIVLIRFFIVSSSFFKSFTSCCSCLFAAHKSHWLPSMATFITGRQWHADGDELSVLFVSLKKRKRARIRDNRPPAIIIKTSKRINARPRRMLPVAYRVAYSPKIASQSDRYFSLLWCIVTVDICLPPGKFFFII